MWIADIDSIDCANQRSSASAGIADDISLPDSDIQRCRTQALSCVGVPGQGAGRLPARVRCPAAQGVFYWKLLLPIVLIVLMSWMVSWIDSGNAGM
jgi:hypothetical protein